jgi:hypothetical protein
MSAASVLDHMLDPLSRCLDEASARRVIQLRVEPSVQERVDYLAEQANEGLLNDEERNEYEALITADEFISVLKIKVQAHLQSGHD